MFKIVCRLSRKATFDGILGPWGNCPKPVEGKDVIDTNHVCRLPKRQGAGSFRRCWGLPLKGTRPMGLVQQKETPNSGGSDDSFLKEASNNAGVLSTATILKRFWMDHLIRAHHYQSLKMIVSSTFSLIFQFPKNIWNQAPSYQYIR